MVRAIPECIAASLARKKLIKDARENTLIYLQRKIKTMLHVANATHRKLHGQFNVELKKQY